MKFSIALLSALSLGLSLAAPHRGHGGKSGPANSTTDSTSEAVSSLDETPGSGGSWDVILDEEDPRSLDEMIAAMGLADDEITYVYNNSAFKGFSATMSSHCADKLTTLGGFRKYQPRVEARFHDTSFATWGLKRISQASPVTVEAESSIASFDLLQYQFEGSTSSLGEGVDIYIVDSGVNVDHADFGGRATFAFSFDGNITDDMGHGTHCAGTAASKTFGVAKAANIIAVRVISPTNGTSSSISKGVDFVINQHDKRKLEPDFKGSIISMSLGTSGISDIIDDVLQKATVAGVHVSVAAGNDNTDSCTSSPAHASIDEEGSSVVSVGAVNINDERASFSNFGGCVTVYAPGEDVTSTWIDVAGKSNVINTISGTSMAAPHVSGLIAYYIGLNSSLSQDPKAMKEHLLTTSLKFASDKSSPDPSIIVNNGFLKQT